MTELCIYNNILYYKSFTTINSEFTEKKRNLVFEAISSAGELHSARTNNRGILVWKIPDNGRPLGTWKSCYNLLYDSMYTNVEI